MDRIQSAIADMHSNDGGPRDGTPRSPDLTRRRASLRRARIERLTASLRAIDARVQGVWDDPDLMAHGPLGPSAADDCEAIAAAALSAGMECDACGDPVATCACSYAGLSASLADGAAEEHA
jgi:hypothetical protein